VPFEAKTDCVCLKCVIGGPDQCVKIQNVVSWFAQTYVIRLKLKYLVRPRRVYIPLKM